MLTDLEDVVEPSTQRVKLMTRIRARIAEMERSLQSSSPRSSSSSSNSFHSTPLPAADKDKRRKVEVNDSAAQADIARMRRGRLHGLASFNQDDEIIARDYELQMKKLFDGLRALAAEEQLDCAPGLAVVLYNRSKRQYRLFFVCSYTLKVLPCGIDGEGFVFSRSASWSRQALPVLRFCVAALRCGLIQHCFDPSSDYPDLCRPSCRAYLNDVLRYLKGDCNDPQQQQHQQNGNVPNVATTQEPDAHKDVNVTNAPPSSIWDLFGALNCAVDVIDGIGFTGRFVLDTLDSGVGSCARVFTGESLVRISADPDVNFRLAVRDVPHASAAFADMLNTTFRVSNWKQLHADSLSVEVCVDDRGIHWVDKSEEILREFRADTGIVA